MSKVNPMSLTEIDRYSAAGLKRIREAYNWPKICRAYEELFMEKAGKF